MSIQINEEIIEIGDEPDESHPLLPHNDDENMYVYSTEQLVDIPDEVWCHIFSFFSIHELLNVGGVSHRFMLISSHDFLWKNINVEKYISEQLFQKDKEYNFLNATYSNTMMKMMGKRLGKHDEYVDWNHMDMLKQVFSREFFVETNRRIFNQKREHKKKMAFIYTPKHHRWALSLLPLLIFGSLCFLFIASVVGSIGYGWFNTQNQGTYLFLAGVISSVFSSLLFVVFVLMCFYCSIVGCTKQNVFRNLKKEGSWIVKRENYKQGQKLKYVLTEFWEFSEMLAMIFSGIFLMIVFVFCLLLRGYLQNNVAFNVCFIPFYVTSLILFVIYVINFLMFPCVERITKKIKMDQLKLVDYRIAWMNGIAVSSTFLFIFIFINAQIFILGLYNDEIISYSTNPFILFIPSFAFLVILLLLFPPALILAIIDLVKYDCAQVVMEQLLCGTTELCCGMSTLILSYSYSTMLTLVIFISICCVPYAIFIVMFSVFYFFKIQLFYTFIPILLTCCLCCVCAPLATFCGLWEREENDWLTL